MLLECYDNKGDNNMKFAYKEDGTVTGYNRAATAGTDEITGTCTPQHWNVTPPGHSTDVTLYTEVDGVPVAKDNVDEILEQRAKDTDLGIAQDARVETFVKTFETDSEAPVEVTIPEGTYTFNGGQDSASFLSGAVQLAVELNEVSVFITDINNVPVELSHTSVMIVATAIGKAYRDAFFAVQAAKVDHVTLLMNGE